MKNTNIPTPHINAKKTDFAKTILMPGDPLRSKYVAEKFLTNAKLVNNIRGVQGYTGTYKGKKVSVMAHGMGMPSMSIYAYELYKFYDIDNIIRIGTCGGLNKELPLKSIILADSAVSSSDIGKRIGYYKKRIECDDTLKSIASKTIEELGKKVFCGRIATLDVFDTYSKININHYLKQKCIAVEMEAYALYATAKLLNKKALTFLTVTDNSFTNEVLPAEQRQNSFDDMVICALETAIRIK